MNLISIGKFSRLTGLSVRALRIYAAEGLLEPQFIDPTTGYRFYHTSQAAIAEKIKNLRQCEMSLEQILQLLKQPRNAHTLLQQHRDFVQERMNHHLTMLHHLDVLLSHTQRPFEVAYRDTKAQAVVYLCQAMDFNKRASYAEIGTAIGQLYEIIRGKLVVRRFGSMPLNPRKPHLKWRSVFQFWAKAPHLPSTTTQFCPPDVMLTPFIQVNTQEFRQPCVGC
jgi:DNA-binding transcriptional MerR regulator